MGIGFTLYFLKKKMKEEPDRWTWKSIIYELALRNVMELREQLSSTIGFLPKIWAYMMKQFIPHVILILFINLAQSSNEDGQPLFGNYGGFPDWPYQILGFGTVIFALGLFLIGFFFPELYSGLSLLDEKNIIHGYGSAQKNADDSVRKLEGGVDHSSGDDNKDETEAVVEDDVVVDA